MLFVTPDPRVEDIAERILWLEDGALRDRKPEQHAWMRDPVCAMRIDASTAVWFGQHGGKRYARSARSAARSASPNSRVRSA